MFREHSGPSACIRAPIVRALTLAQPANGRFITGQLRVPLGKRRRPPDEGIIPCLLYTSMNRKMLSETAIHDAAAFTALCEKAKAAL